MESAFRWWGEQLRRYIVGLETELGTLIQDHEGDLQDLLMQVNAAFETRYFMFLKRAETRLSESERMPILSFLEHEKQRLKLELQETAEEALMSRKRRIFLLLEEMKNELKYDIAKRYFEDNEALKEMEQPLAECLHPLYQQRYDALKELYSQKLDELESKNLQRMLTSQDFEQFKEDLYQGIDEVQEHFKQECEQRTHQYFEQHGREEYNPF